MQKIRKRPTLSSTLLLAMLALSIVAIVELMTSSSFAMTMMPGNQTKGKMMSGNMTGNMTKGNMTSSKMMSNSTTSATSSK
jgi:hypothetical protein